MYSSEYKALQEQFHKDRPDYGISGSRYADSILQLANKLQTKDILDFGAGKCTLAKNLPFPIQSYDPFIPELAERPHPARLVTCTDVMEHVEPEYVEAVLDDIASLTIQAVFFQIAARPASKVLPDGRNAHLIVEKPNWWLQHLLARWDAKSFQDMNGGFIFLGAARNTKNISTSKVYCGMSTRMGHGDNAICGEPYIKGIYQCTSCQLKELKART